MLNRIIIIAVLGATLGFPVMGNAQEPDTDLLKAVNALKQKLGDGWIIEWNAHKTALKSIELARIDQKTIDQIIINEKITDPESIAVKSEELEFAYSQQRGEIALLTNSDEGLSTPEDFAMIFIKNNAILFQLSAGINDLRVERVDGAEDYGFSVAIQQTFNGLPVFGRGINLIVGIKAGVYSVHNSYQPDRKKKYPTQQTGIYSLQNNYLPNINISTTPQLSEDYAITIAQLDTLEKHMNTWDKSGKPYQFPSEGQKKPFIEKPKLELGIYVTEKEQPILAYQFNLSGHFPMRYVIDANNGTILFRDSLSRCMRQDKAIFLAESSEYIL